MLAGSWNEEQSWDLNLVPVMQGAGVTQRPLLFIDFSFHLMEQDTKVHQEGMMVPSSPIITDLTSVMLGEFFCPSRLGPS